MIPAKIVTGHGVASGRNGDKRFPNGTISLQLPLFAQQGLDTTGLFPGTINLDIAPASYTIVEPKITIENLTWHPDSPPETFSFFDCQLTLTENAPPVSALIYHPHPETKPEHFQPSTVLEILAKKIPNLKTDQRLHLDTTPDQIILTPKT